MSKALHLKYRPDDLDHFAGNADAVGILEVILKRDSIEDMPHAFLFYGPSGCGKTTLARIIKNELKCASEDFVERDTASHSRGIDSIRTLIENSALSPMAGPVRFYLLDEAHQITGAAKEALLKFLEDTPDHVFVALCTTEPERLPRTIHTRCTKIKVSALRRKEMTDLLEYVLKEEGVEDFPEKAISKIVKNSEGSPRQALVLLDSVIDIEDDEEMMSAIDRLSFDTSTTIELSRLILSPDRAWVQIAESVKGLRKEGTEAETIRLAIQGYLVNVLLNSKKPDMRVIDLLDLFNETFIYSRWGGLTSSCALALKI